MLIGSEAEELFFGGVLLESKEAGINSISLNQTT